MQNITLKNLSLKVEICPLGAELQSIIKDGVQYLWQGDPAIWKDRAPVLFPIVGGLKNGEYTYHGQTYKLPQHGFARSSSFEVKEADQAHAVFALHSSDETRKAYPFDFELNIGYYLKDNTIEVKYTVVNKTSGEMYFSIGAHEGYCCPIEKGEAFADYYMEFDQPVTHERYLIVDKLIAIEAEKFLENQKTFDLKHDYFEVDALVFKDVQTKFLTLKSKKSSRAVKVGFEGFPFLGIWQKPGAPYICIEPWYGIADSVTASGDITQKEGILRLDEGKSLKCVHIIEIT